MAETAFYLSILVSTTGSMLLTLGLVTCLPFPLFQVSWLILISRIAPMIISLTLPDIANRYSPQKILVTTEILAGTFSLLLLYCFKHFPDNFEIFFLLMLGRSAATSIQISSKAKLNRIYAGENLGGNILRSSLLLLSSQGATIITGIIGYGFLSLKSLDNFIIIDALTFLVSGIMLLSTIDKSPAFAEKKMNIFHGMKTFFGLPKKLILLDLFLSVSMAGFWTFNKKIAANQNEKTTSIFLILYGTSVILTGYIVNKVSDFKFLPIFAIALTSSFASYLMSSDWLTVLTITFVRDFSYWMLLQYTSAKIQHLISVEDTSATISYRTLQMISILSAGEVASALAGENLLLECAIRGSAAVICLLCLKK